MTTCDKSCASSAATGQDDGGSPGDGRTVRPASLVVREYSLVREALLSPRFTAAHPFRATRQLFGPTAIDVDGARHRQLRAHVAWFSGAQVLKWQQSAVVPVVSDIVPALPRGEPVDFMTVASQFPTRVILRILGCPDADAGWVWQRLVPVVRHIAYPGNPVAAVKACAELGEYVREKLAGAPPGSVLSSLSIKAGEHGQGEAVTTVRSALLLLAAGTATTGAATGNLMVSLLRHPAVWSAVRAGEIRPSEVIRETLRLLPPLQRTVRFTAADTTLGSVAVARGSVVELDLAAANRDPAVFKSPQDFRIGRPGHPLMSFGAGQHACAGALLAMLELESLLTALAARFKSVSAIGAEAVMTKGNVFHQPDGLELIFR